MTGWQDMNTAPRDGTPVRGYWPTNGTHPTRVGATAYDPEARDWFSTTFVPMRLGEPTGWRPLGDTP